MMNETAMKGQEQSPAETAQRDLASALDELSAVFDRLEARLAPVLSPSLPGPPEEKRAAGDSSPLVAVLHTRTDEVQRLTRWAERTTARLEI